MWPVWGHRGRKSGMSKPHLLQQSGRTGATAGRGADSEARPTAPRDAGDHGSQSDQGPDEGPSRSFLLILLRALGAMHT